MEPGVSTCRSLVLAAVSAALVCVWPSDGRAQTSMRGFADLHNHQLANLAFGGRAVVGDAGGRIDWALSDVVDRNNHGVEHTLDHVGSGMARREMGDLLYGNDGYPKFRGWPAFYEVDHQKVYKDWLRQAVRGGLRLMVMFAVDSPAMCRQTANDGRDCDNEMATIETQLRAAYDLQRDIDDDADGGWYRIVKTPGEAREVIQAGRLAVVLGIETAHLFGCERDVACDWRGQLDYFWNTYGVRHFFPIHHEDNRFGTPSFFTADLQQTNHFWTRLTHALSWISPYFVYTAACPQYTLGRCSPHGLTGTGKDLVREVMARGGIIDVDHMSDRSFADTLDLAEQFRYPVVASHAGFNEINRQAQNHDGQLTAAELRRIAGVGGMVGLITGQGDLKEVVTYQRPGKHYVAHVCGRTTETFAQAYYYAIDKAPGMSIGLGTDMNTPLSQPGPRFGGFQCFGFTPSIAQSLPAGGFAPGTPFFSRNRDWSQAKWERPLVYPFLARGAGVYLQRYVSGERQYDYNVDGLAHVGLLPDFLADLEALEVPASDLEPMFTSAEGYVRMWERAHASSVALRRNAGFEWRTLNAWAVYSPEPGFSATTTSERAASGGYSLAEANSMGIVYQDVDGLQPGRTYVVSARVSWSSGASAPGELSMHNTAGGNFSQRVVSPSTGWRSVSLLYTADRTGRARIHLVRQAGAGVVFWDDVTLTEAPNDPGFEQGGLTAWSVYSPQAGFSARTASHRRRTGTFSLAEEGTVGIVYQDIGGLTAGKVYVVSAWVRRSSGATAEAELSVHNTAGGQSRQRLHVPGDAWTRVSLAYTADATERVRVHLVRGSGTGTVYWDDVSLTEAPVNGGFERGDAESWATYSPQEGFTAAVSGWVRRSGGLSLAQRGAFGITYQDVSGLVPGRTYRVNAYVRWASGASAPAELSVHNTSGAAFARVVAQPTTGWQLLTLSYTADPTGNIRIHLVRQEGAGEIYWDDVSVIDTTPPPPAPPSNTRI
jgi:microsomal dipeptidase-like Zn-dependent dipeptidase